MATATPAPSGGSPESVVLYLVLAGVALVALAVVIRARLARAVPRRGPGKKRAARAGPDAPDSAASFVFGPVRQIVCGTDNRSLITGAIDTATVGALVTTLSSQFGATGPPPGVLITTAVLVLKIGVNELCRGYPAPSSVPAKASGGKQKPAAPDANRPRGGAR